MGALKESVTAVQARVKPDRVRKHKAYRLVPRLLQGI
jgi:hypothetical protein